MMLQTITTNRGKLTVAEKLPFQVKRAYWLHSIDVKANRPGHAHKALHRVMVAANGSFRVTMRSRRHWQDTVLSNPSEALFIEPMTWVELSDFSPDAVCLVLASEEYDESDVIRDFHEFIKCR